MPRPSFQPSDTYLRFFNFRTRAWEYIWLVERDGPIIYPFRFAALAAGSEQSQPTVFEDLAPDEKSHHIYQAFIGVYPEIWYKLWHPYNVQLLRLDGRVEDISEDLVHMIRYDDSPHDAPRVDIWVDEKRFPAIQPRNVGRRSVNPKVEFTLMKYRVEFDSEISPAIRDKLVSGEIPSLPITFGGEI